MGRNYTDADSAVCAGCPEYRQVSNEGNGKGKGKKWPKKE